MRENDEQNCLEGTYLIKDFETLKVIADPIRNQILEVLQFSPQNVKEVADKLGLAPSKLYYHFNMLEKYGFIEVVETRQVANLIEKYYKATTTFLSIDPGLLTFSTDEGKENLRSVVEAAIDTTREDLIRSFQARTYQLERGASQKSRHLIITRRLANMSDEKYQEFHEKMNALIKEFDELDSKDAQEQTFAFTVALYPSFYYRDLSEE